MYIIRSEHFISRIFQARFLYGQFTIPAITSIIFLDLVDPYYHPLLFIFCFLWMLRKSKCYRQCTMVSKRYKLTLNWNWNIYFFLKINLLYCDDQSDRNWSLKSLKRRKFVLFILLLGNCNISRCKFIQKDKIVQKI